MKHTAFVGGSLGHASRGSPAITEGSENEGRSHWPKFFLHDFEELRKLEVMEEEAEGDIMSSSHGFNPCSAELSPTKVPAMMPKPEKPIETLLRAGLEGEFSKVLPSFVGERGKRGNGFRDVGSESWKFPSNMRFRLDDWRRVMRRGEGLKGEGYRGRIPETMGASTFPKVS